MVTASVKVNVITGEKANQDGFTIKCHQPTDEEREKYNVAIKGMLVECDFGGVDLTERVVCSTRAVFEAHGEYRLIASKQKNSYVRKECLALIKQRDNDQGNANVDNEAWLNK